MLIIFHFFFKFTTLTKRCHYKSTTVFEVTLRRLPSDYQLLSYADSDYAGDLSKSRSTTGFIVFVAGGPIEWISKRQEYVTKSTMEAELVALSAASDCVRWVKMFIQQSMSDLEQIPPITIYCDNKSAVDTAINGIVNRRTRHYRVRVHALNQDINNGEITVTWIPTQDQTADFLTKALPSDVFQRCRSRAEIH